MSTRLRGLNPMVSRRGVPRGDATLLFWGAMFAIALQMTFSSNVLNSFGLSIKVHPSTVLLVVLTVIGVARGSIAPTELLRQKPMLMLYVLGIPALIAYSVYFVGLSGSTVFIETFVSAGLLALLLEPASDKRRRLLGRMLMGLVLLNAVLALYESVTHTELFPVAYDPDTADLKENAGTEDFRAHAFYPHPLTASLITGMAFYLLYTMRMRFLFAAPIFAVMLVGLLAFGGRTALGITVLITAFVAFYTLMTGIIRRNLRLDFVLSLIAAAIVLPIGIWFVVTQTTIADRIMDTLYYDGSAQARATQWEVFNHLNMQDWLFGISKDRLASLKYQIGLGGKETDIENFWILICLDLGIIGFTAFVGLFLGFLVHLGRYARCLMGWLVIAAALIIDSGSNSLGVWSCDLMLEVAFVMAISGYRDYVPVRGARRLRRSLPTVRDMLAARSGLAALPRPLRTQGLRGAMMHDRHRAEPLFGGNSD